MTRCGSIIVRVCTNVCVCLSVFKELYGACMHKCVRVVCVCARCCVCYA